MADIIITPNSGIIDFYPGSTRVGRIDGSGNSLIISNPSGYIVASGSGFNVNTSSGIAKVNLYSATTGDIVLNVAGTNGSLFSVTDSLSGSLFSANTIAGLPVLEVFSDYSIKGGRFNQNDFVVSSGGNIGIGTGIPSAKLHVSNDIKASEIDFAKIGESAVQASIYLSNSDLIITSTSGDVIVGDPTQDIYIGNGTNEIDIVYEQNGEIRALPTKTLTVGASGSSVNILATKIGINRNLLGSIPVDIYSSTSGATLLSVEGTNGNLFTVVDSLSGSLMSVNNIAGLPVFEVFSDDRVVAGRYSQNDLIITSGGNVGIGHSAPLTKLAVSGSVGISGLLTSTSGNFLSSLQVNGTGVSISGHSHTISDITNFGNSVSGLMAGSGNYISKFNSSGSGIRTSLMYDDGTKIGIGTNSPSGQLHVVGTGVVSNRLGIGIGNPQDLIHISGATNNIQGIRFDGLNGYGGSIGVANNILYFSSSTATAFRVQASKIRLGDGSSTAAIELTASGSISQDGNGGGLTFSGTNARFSNGINVTGSGTFTSIGVGTQTPNAQLQVIGSGLFSSGIVVGDSSSNSYIYGAINPATNNIRFNNGGGDRIDFNSSQLFYVGTSFFQGNNYATRVGETTSTATQKDSYQLVFQNALWDGSGGQYSTSAIRSVASTSQNLTSRLGFFTHNGTVANTQVERMCITSSGGYVGIGTTTPTAQLQVVGTGSFTSIDINNSVIAGQGALTVNGGIVTQGSFVRTSSFSIYGDSTTQIYKPDSSTLGYAVASTGLRHSFGFNNAGTHTPWMVITSSGVGIGTTNPSGQLHVIGTGVFDNIAIGTTTTSVGATSYKLLVDGDVSIGSGNANRSLTIYGNHVSAKRTVLKNVNGDSFLSFAVGNQNLSLGETGGLRFNNINYYAGASSAGLHRFFVSNDTTPEVVIGSGSLGIGTTSPSTQLHVIGSGLFSGDVTVSGSVIGGSGTALFPSFEFINDSDTGLFSPAANVFGISTSGVERLRINNSGLIGIGTTNPTSQLQVMGTGNFTQALQVNGTGVSISGHSHSTSDITNFGSSFSGLLPSTLVYSTGTNYSNGRLLIGSGTSLVANTLTAGTGIVITNGSGTITINTSGLQTALTNPVTGTGLGASTSGYLSRWISNSGLSNSTIYQNGSFIGIGTTTPSYSLDLRGTLRANSDTTVNNTGCILDITNDGVSLQTLSAQPINLIAGTIGNGGTINIGINESDTLNINSTNVKFFSTKIGIGGNDPDTSLQVYTDFACSPGDGGGSAMNGGQGVYINNDGTILSYDSFPCSIFSIDQNYGLKVYTNNSVGNALIISTDRNTGDFLIGDSTLVNQLNWNITSAGRASFKGGLSSDWNAIDNEFFINTDGNGSLNMGETLSLGYAFGTRQASISCPWSSGLSISNTNSQPILFNIDGNEKLRLSNNGIGIGTTNPTSQLHVIGSGIFSSGITVNNNGGGRFYMDYNSSNMNFINTTGNVFFIGDGAGGSNVIAKYQTSTTGAQLFFRKYRGSFASPAITASGDPIGTLRYELLNATGTLASPCQIQVITEATPVSGQPNVPASIVFNTAQGTDSSSIQRMLIRSDGNVGIGTSTPLTKLHVNGLVSQSATHASAGLSTDQTIIAASGDTILQLTDKDDPNNWWNASTYRFIPTSSGYYFIAAQVNWDPGAGNGQLNIQLRKNGTTFAICQNPMVTGVTLTQHANGIVNLNGSTDYVDLTAYTSTTNTSQIVNGTADRAWTKLEAYKIS